MAGRCRPAARCLASDLLRLTPDSGQCGARPGSGGLVRSSKIKCTSRPSGASLINLEGDGVFAFA